MITDTFKRLNYQKEIWDIIEDSNKKISEIASRFESGEVVVLKTISFDDKIVSCEKLTHACSECGHEVESMFGDLPLIDEHNSRCFYCKKETRWVLKREDRGFAAANGGG